MFSTKTKHSPTRRKKIAKISIRCEVIAGMASTILCLLLVGNQRACRPTPASIFWNFTCNCKGDCEHADHGRRAWQPLPTKHFRFQIHEVKWL